MELCEVIEGLEELRAEFDFSGDDEGALLLSESIRYLKPIYNGEFTTDSEDVNADMGMLIK